MNHPKNTHLLLKDLLADLHFARKHEQLGRLALLAFCDVKRWARLAGKHEVADTALRMFSSIPCINKVDFLQSIDKLIEMLELHDQQYHLGDVVLINADSGSSSLRMQC